MRRVLIILLVLGIIVAGAFEWESAKFTSAGPPTAHGVVETDVLIKPGVGLHGIAEELAAAGVIERADLFERGVRLRPHGGEAEGRRVRDPGARQHVRHHGES